MHEDTFFYCVNNPTSYSSYIYKKNVLSLKDLCHETCYLDNIFLLKFPILRSYLNWKSYSKPSIFLTLQSNIRALIRIFFYPVFLSRVSMGLIDWLETIRENLAYLYGQLSHAALPVLVDACSAGHHPLGHRGHRPCNIACDHTLLENLTDDTIA